MNNALKGAVVTLLSLGLATSLPVKAEAIPPAQADSEINYSEHLGRHYITIGDPEAAYRYQLCNNRFADVEAIFTYSITSETDDLQLLDTTEFVTVPYADCIEVHSESSHLYVQVLYEGLPPRLNQKTARKHKVIHNDFEAESLPSAFHYADWRF